MQASLAALDRAPALAGHVALGLLALELLVSLALSLLALASRGRERSQWSCAALCAWLHALLGVASAWGWEGGPMWGPLDPTWSLHSVTQCAWALVVAATLRGEAPGWVSVARRATVALVAVTTLAELVLVHRGALDLSPQSSQRLLAWVRLAQPIWWLLLGMPMLRAVLASRRDGASDVAVRDWRPLALVAFAAGMLFELVLPLFRRLSPNLAELAQLLWLRAGVALSLSLLVAAGVWGLRRHPVAGPSARMTLLFLSLGVLFDLGATWVMVWASDALALMGSGEFLYLGRARTDLKLLLVVAAAFRTSAAVALIEAISRSAPLAGGAVHLKRARWLSLATFVAWVGAPTIGPLAPLRALAVVCLVAAGALGAAAMAELLRGLDAGAASRRALSAGGTSRSET